MHALKLFHFPILCVCLCLCVIGGHRMEMLCNDWWLRVIYGVPGLQNASPHCIILYPSVMQMINSHHFMMNYFLDLHFDDNTSTHVACLLLRNRQTTRRNPDDSSVQNYIRSLCERERRRRGGNVPKLLLKVKINGRFRVEIKLGLQLANPILSPANQWPWDEREATEMEGKGAKTSNVIRFGHTSSTASFVSFILQPTNATAISI